MIAEPQRATSRRSRPIAGWTLPIDPTRIAALRKQGTWRNRTVGEDALELAQNAPERLIAIADEVELTAGEAVSRALALAAALRRRGLERGDVVTMILPNWLEAIVVNLAAAFCGLIVNPVVPIYREAELRQILRDCGSRAVFHPGRYRSLDYDVILAAIRRDLPCLSFDVGVRSGGQVLLDDLIAREGRGGFHPDLARPEEIKLVLYTSGTTGAAKGVLHTHETLGRVMTVGAANWEVPPGPRLLIATPVGHVTGFLWGLESPFLVGTTVFLQSRWDPDEAVRLIDRHEIVVTTGAAPFLQDTTEAARRAGSRLPSLLRYGCGGAAVSPSLINSAHETFAQAVAYRTFGSTEAPNITQGHASPLAGRRSAETDGRPVDYEVRIIDETGAPVPDGTDGEILARGPAMFVGYTDAALNSGAIDPDGFYMTGDIGHRTPEGDIVITDRKKDIIIRGGENLSPKEIEDAILLHSAVREVAVVGQPHERLGETVAAFIVTHPDRRLDLVELSAGLTAFGLARQKLPETIRFVELLPKTPSGKVRKDQLRKELTS